MSRLARPDLNQVAFASDSFLGRVIVLGQDYEKLPDNIADVLMAYLRAKGLAFAQRYRSGIALGRDGLERGVRQSLVCLEIGLEDRAAGDVNAAVDLLAQGEFEALRQRGWELAFARLEEMRRETPELAEQPEFAYLQGGFDEVAHWARIVPETWMGEGETGQEQLIDPLRDYAAFVDLRDQVRFVQTLPRQELRKLLRQVPRGGSFAAILRNLIAALALDQQALVATPESVEQFQRQCFVDGRMVQEVREKVLDLAGQHLTGAVADAEMRQRIGAAIAAQIGELERASTAHIGDLTVVC
jgi:hypothetical protein